MESFIRHQMMAILQPMSEQMQELDGRVARLTESLGRTDTALASAVGGLDAAHADSRGLRADLGETNARLGLARQGLDEAKERDELLQQGMELANGFAQRLHNQLEATTSLVPELQRGIGEMDCQLQAVRAHTQRTSDSVQLDVQGGLQRMGVEIKEFRDWREKSGAEMSQLRSDLGEQAGQLQDARQLLNATTTTTGELRTGFRELTSREGQMGERLNDWKHQWSKLQPRLDSMTKDVAQLKQLSEHHESGICSLQQGCAMNLGSIETLQGTHVKTTFDLQALHQSISSTQRDLADTREALSRAGQFSTTLQSGLLKSDNELRRVSLKVDALESKHISLCDAFEKTSGSVADLSREHYKSATHMQNLRHELGKTNDTLSGAREQLQATETGLVGLRGEMGRTTEVVQRLDQGVEHCHATFAGLQKGFVETGSAARRLSATTLPKLSPDATMETAGARRPDSATSTAESSGTASSLRFSRRTTACD